jgi:DNA-binding response OmpR family regulator
MSKKIVVADDQDDILRMMQSILSRQGYEVETDATGNLLDEIGNEHPDLIILDINLGNRDGSDICRKLKEQEFSKHIPVILISAVMDLPKISESCGADDYLAKPFRLSDLINKVQQNLQAA